MVSSPKTMSSSLLESDSSLTRSLGVGVRESDRAVLKDKHDILVRSNDVKSIASHTPVIFDAASVEGRFEVLPVPSGDDSKLITLGKVLIRLLFFGEGEAGCVKSHACRLRTVLPK